MRTLKSVFVVIAALVPIFYCGGLVYYFLDLSGSVQDAETNGLGPTLLGLGAAGLFFCIPLIMKIVRIFGPGSPGSSGGSDAPNSNGGIDADAAIARHLARRSAEAAPSPPVPSAREGSGPAKRPSFGRRIT